jgi:hypothetical protein
MNGQVIDQSCPVFRDCRSDQAVIILFGLVSCLHLMRSMFHSIVHGCTGSNIHLKKNCWSSFSHAVA